MNESERFRLAAELFLEASGIPKDDVPAFLEDRCGGDGALRLEVEALLAASDDASVFRELASRLRPVQSRLRADLASESTLMLGRDLPGSDAATGRSDRFPEERAGETIGRYKLLELIGEGGFGRVWVAEQREPVARRIALKIIKIGMDTRQVVARFEQEQQALALMDHPNIAKVFDAGVTASGRPYFVMELCKGDSISVYCDRHRLDLKQRLEVFRQVCSAVQHAHTKGVIHRDIKPGNVLATTQDGRPLVKVIDFGIAKAMDARLTEKTLFTQHRQLIGTLEYMSPEQAEGSLDIDTRTDVYSLGVLLYELLTGSPPFTGAALRSAAFEEMQRIIREVDPPRPSLRLSRTSERIDAIAQQRGSDPMRIGSLVRGELDWIVMKSLEKDRGRRYASPGALAEDIGRFLTGEAVQAAPPSRSYRAAKFVRRNRAAVLSASAIALALVAGAAASTWQALEASRERDRAVLAEAATELRADELQRVSDFQSQMLSQVDAAAAGLRLTMDVRDRYSASLVRAGVPESERGAMSAAFADEWARVNATDIALELIDSTILAPALDALDRQFVDQPMVDARLRGAIAERYLDLGLIEPSWSVAEAVVEILRGAAGEEHRETINAEILRSRVRNARGESAVAESELRELLAAHRPRLGEDDPLMLLAATQLGIALNMQAEYPEAESLFREVLESHRRTLGDDDPLTLHGLANVAATLRDQGRYAEAEPFEREALEGRRRVLGDDHPDTIQSGQNMSMLLLNQGKLIEAEAAGARVVEAARRVLGELHPTTLQAIGNLASMMDRNGKIEEAERLQRDVLDRFEAALGDDHLETINAVSNLATYLIPQARFEEAGALSRRALDTRLRLLGRDHPNTLISFNVMGFLMQRQNRPAEALTYLREAFDASISVLGEDHPDRLILLINMGSLSGQLDKPDEAVTYFRDAIERVVRTLGEDHPYFLPPVQSLADLLVKQNKFSEAIELLSMAEPACRRATAIRDDGALARLLLNLGIARSATQDYEAAEANLIEAHALFVGGLGPTHPRVRQCADALVKLYTAWHAAEPEAGHDARLIEWEQKLRDATPESVPAEGI